MPVSREEIIRDLSARGATSGIAPSLVFSTSAAAEDDDADDGTLTRVDELD